jgi:hypothetical protein
MFGLNKWLEEDTKGRGKIVFWMRREYVPMQIDSDTQPVFAEFALNNFKEKRA